MAGKMDGWGGSAGVTSDMTAAAGLVLGDALAQSMYQERLRLYHCANDGMEETHGTLAGLMPSSRPLSALSPPARVSYPYPCRHCPSMASKPASKTHHPRFHAQAVMRARK
jgi:hypothetical protein